MYIKHIIGNNNNNNNNSNRKELVERSRNHRKAGGKNKARKNYVRDPHQLGTGDELWLCEAGMAWCSLKENEPWSPAELDTVAGRGRGWWCCIDGEPLSLSSSAAANVDPS